MQTYSPTELAEAFGAPQPPVIIDIAGPEAFDRGHLPHAMNVPAGPEFAERVMDLIPEPQTSVILSAPFESTALEESAEALRRAGYRKVAGYKGDSNAWRPEHEQMQTDDAHAGPSVKASPRLQTRRWKVKKRRERTFMDRAKSFATKRLLRRFVPGWNVLTAFQDIGKALRKRRDGSPSAERAAAWGAAGTGLLGAANIPVISQLSAAASAALSWFRDRGESDDQSEDA